MRTHSKIKSFIIKYEEHTGERPKALILDSFTAEKLRIERVQEKFISYDNSAITSFEGIPVLRLEDVIVI